MALNDQGFRAALAFLSPIPRACEGRADPATSVSSATHKQLDPPAPPAGRRRHSFLRGIRFSDFRLRANAGARAIAANAAAAARFSYGVLAKAWR